MRKFMINRKGHITWLKSRRCYNWHGLVDKYLLVFDPFTCDICQNEVTVIILWVLPAVSLRKKPTFCYVITGYPAKGQLFTQATPAITRLNVSFVWLNSGMLERKYTGKKEGNLKLAPNRMINKINP